MECIPALHHVIITDKNVNGNVIIFSNTTKLLIPLLYFLLRRIEECTKYVNTSIKLSDRCLF